MIANLSSHKRGWDDRWEEFSDHAEKGKAAHAELLDLIDRDTLAFNDLVAAWRADPAAREEAIESTTRRAIEVPLRIMEVALESMGVLHAMAGAGLEASVSDAGVGELFARAAVAGAGLNVRINAQSLKDDEATAAYLQQATELTQAATRMEATILAIVDGKLDA